MCLPCHFLWVLLKSQLPILVRLDVMSLSVWLHSAAVQHPSLEFSLIRGILKVQMMSGDQFERNLSLIFHLQYVQYTLTLFDCVPRVLCVLPVLSD